MNDKHLGCYTCPALYLSVISGRRVLRTRVYSTWPVDLAVARREGLIGRQGASSR
jgi:hypothetical protein